MTEKFKNWENFKIKKSSNFGKVEKKIMHKSNNEDIKKRQDLPKVKYKNEV